MKRLTTIVFILIQFLNVYSRESELPDSSFIWTIRSIGWGQCNSTFSYMLAGDTLINNRIYKQIHLTPDSIFSWESSSFYCSARDSSGLWFFIPNGDSTEYLLYDFNAAIGDTIKINNPWSVGEVDAFVLSKDSILINNEYKDRIGIGVRQGEFWEYWIEDIGCLSGLFYSCYFICDEGYELSCIYLGDEYLYNFGYYEYCGCGPRTSNYNLSDEPEIILYPNPSYGQLNINNHTQEALTFYFYTSEGRLLDAIEIDKFNTKSITIRYRGMIVVRIVGANSKKTQIIQMI